MSRGWRQSCLALSLHCQFKGGIGTGSETEGDAESDADKEGTVTEVETDADSRQDTPGTESATEETEREEGTSGRLIKLDRSESDSSLLGEVGCEGGSESTTATGRANKVGAAGGWAWGAVREEEKEADGLERGAVD